MIYVFDTSAFIKGMDVNVIDQSRCYTTDGVLSEIKNSFKRQRIDISIQSRKLIIASPSLEAVRKAKQAALQSGDLPFLSSVDIDLIALAITLTTDVIELADNTSLLEVITDDYSIQNVLKHLNIRIHSFMQKGIRDFIRWEIYCPVCNKIYKADKNNYCTDCEVKLKRRPIQ